VPFGHTAGDDGDTVTDPSAPLFKFRHALNAPELLSAGFPEAAIANPPMAKAVRAAAISAVPTRRPLDVKLIFIAGSSQFGDHPRMATTAPRRQILIPGQAGKKPGTSPTSWENSPPGIHGG